MPESSSTSNISDLTALMNLINQVNPPGRTVTGSGTTVEQIDYSDAALQEIIRGILAGEGGVATIGAGERRSGIYNSTVRNSRLAELYARAANQAAIARAPRTVRTSEQKEEEVEGQGDILGMVLGGLQAYQTGDKLFSSLFGGGGTAAAPATSVGTTSTIAPEVGAGIKAVATQSASAEAGTAAPAAAAGGEAAGGAFSGGAATGEAIANFLAIAALANIHEQNAELKGRRNDEEHRQWMDILTANNIGQDYNALTTHLFGDESKQAQVLGSQMGIATLPNLIIEKGVNHSIMQALTGGFAPQTLTFSDFIANPIEGLEDIGSNAKDVVSEVFGDTVICTALKNKGMLSKQNHYRAAVYGYKLHPWTKAGYRYWADSIAAKIDAGNKWATKFWLPIARSRTELLALEPTVRNHLKYPIGTLTKFLVEPACWVIGACLYLANSSKKPVTA